MILSMTALISQEFIPVVTMSSKILAGKIVPGSSGGYTAVGT